MIKKGQVVIVKSGRHKGREFHVVDDLLKMQGCNKDTLLVDLADQGNMAALNALLIDKYDDLNDAPFYYGRIQEGEHWLGYIISLNNLLLEDNNDRTNNASSIGSNKHAKGSKW